MSKKFRIPKYCRHARGSAYVFYKRKYHYLGAYGTEDSRKRYRKLLDLIEMDAASEVAIELDTKLPHQRYVADVVNQYLDYAERYYVDTDGKTTNEYRCVCDTMSHVAAVLGDEFAGKVGPKLLTKLQTHFVRHGFSRGVANQMLGRVKRMFAWACKFEICPPEVHSRLACVKGLTQGRTTAPDHADVLPVPQSVVDATLPFMSPIPADMVRLQLLCGMRPAEVCRMRPVDIDRSLDVWIYEPPKHKNAWRGQVRLIAVPLAAQAILSPYLKRDAEAFLFSPREAERARSDERAGTIGADRKTKVYPSELRARERRRKERLKTRFTQLNDCYTSDTYRRAITYGIRKANQHRKPDAPAVPHWFPYQLRHARATEVDEALGIEAAACLLGHAEVSTTAIYVKRQRESLIRTARKLEAIVTTKGRAESSPPIAARA